MKRQPPPMRPLEFLGSTREDLRAMPKPVRVAFGFGLNEAQRGDAPHAARPLHGFGGAGVLEIVDDHAGDTYRAVYTVRFADRVKERLERMLAALHQPEALAAPRGVSHGIATSLSAEAKS